MTREAPRRTLLGAGALGAAGLAVGPSLMRSPAAAAAPPAGVHLGLGHDAARTAVVS